MRFSKGKNKINKKTDSVIAGYCIMGMAEYGAMLIDKRGMHRG